MIDLFIVSIQMIWLFWIFKEKEGNAVINHEFIFWKEMEIFRGCKIFDKKNEEDSTLLIGPEVYEWNLEVYVLIQILQFLDKQKKNQN